MREGDAPVSPSAGEVSEAEARCAVIETARAMSRQGLSPGRSGNVSRRWGCGMLITPSGMAYDALAPSDIVMLADDGSATAGQRRPSSEWRFHRAAYAARPDMHAIVHAHSLHAVVLSCAHKPIPAFHYMVAVAGGSDIPCIPYATFGTEELARHVAAGLAQRNACLMANHGQIALGGSLCEALQLATEVETLAEQYCKLLAIGEPHLLEAAEMARVLARFRNYGQLTEPDRS
jgi:L-fuculose-phosphate aldolase